MAKQVVALEVTANMDNATKSVGSLKQQLKLAQKEVEALSDKFGATSKEAIEAAKAAAKLKDSIGDAKALTDAYNPDAKFQAFGAAVQGVAGGFAALQGAQGLFGSQSEELEKTLLKVQSAMALSQGLNSIMAAKDAFMNLGAMVKGQVVQAFNFLKVTLLANPIFALVTIIAGVALSFKKVRDAIINFIPGLKETIEFFGKLIDTVSDWIGATSDATRALDAMTAAQERNSAAIDNQIKILQAVGGKQDEIFKLKEKQIVEEIRLLDKKNEVEGELSKEELQRKKDLFADLVVLNIEDSNAKKEKLKKDQDDKDKADKEAFDKQKAFNDKSLQQRKEHEAKVRDLIKELEISVQDLKSTDFEKEENRLIRERDSRLAIAMGNADALYLIERDFYLKMQELKNKFAPQVDEKAEVKEPIAVVQKRAEVAALEGLENSVTENIAKNVAVRRTIFQLEAEEKEALLEKTSSTLNVFADLVGKQTAAGKVLAIASATIDTYQAANKALKADYGIFGPGAQIARVLSVASTIAMGIKSVKSIAAVKVPGASGGGGGSIPSGGIVAPLTPQAQTTRLDQNSINQIGNAAAPRAYVVERDITNAQQRDNQLKRAARIN